MGDDDSFEAPAVILTAKEIMEEGLVLVNYTLARIYRTKNSKTNKQRFKDHFGCSPSVCARIFEDLQTTDDENARLDDKMISIHALLMTLHLMYRYPTEKQAEAIFDLSPKTMRQKVRYYIKKIQALKAEKIQFPDCSGTDIWILYVDCVDSLLNEPRHPILSKDPDFFSFKFNHAGMRYELGTDLYRSAVVWMNGPFPAGEDNDKGIFVKQGLKDKLESVGKKCIADGIYTGYPHVCSTFNALDRKDVAKFKSRAQMRHEQFNGMIKEFDCLSRAFRHKKENFAAWFEAVVVVCIYRIENGEPLFNILAGL